MSIQANKALCWTLWNQSRNSIRRACRPHFDDSLCWEETDLDTVVGQPCPFKFCSDCALQPEERMATRHCLPNGTWAVAEYGQCVYIYVNTTCIEKSCNPCTDPFRQTLMNVTLALSILSVLTLLTSVCLFSWLKSIHCRRLTIHAHLALAFVMRFATYTIWILLQRDQVLQGCGGIMTRQTGDWLCKTILFFIMYSTVASTFWMFVEGAYLVSRFSIYAMRASDGPLWLYLLVGWGGPLIFVSLWALSLELQPTVQFCWVPFTTTWALWFLVGPMSVALVLNVLFLVIVIVVVIQKMHSASSSESAKIWQTIKSTLLLVPLLGVTNLLLFYEPSERETMAFKVYLLVTAVLQHSQGIFVAILYCFANGEVQSAVKREVKKLNITRHLLHRNGPARTVSMVTQADAYIISTLADDDSSSTTTEQKWCLPSKKNRRFPNFGKMNAICSESPKGQRKMVSRDLSPSAPFMSRNSPIRKQYQSCVVFNNDVPRVIITAPDDDE